MTYPHEEGQEGNVKGDADCEAADSRQGSQNGALIFLCQRDPCQAPLHMKHYPGLDNATRYAVQWGYEDKNKDQHDRAEAEGTKAGQRCQREPVLLLHKTLPCMCCCCERKGSYLRATLLCCGLCLVHAGCYNQRSGQTAT